MNTAHLKKFAQEARVKLIEQVGARLDYVLNADTAELRESSHQLQQLRKELNATTREQLIDKVAYTWFNRLMALRYMDANDYQPLGIRIITPIDGYFNPEILDEAKRGNIPDDLNIKREKVMDLLDGNIKSSNPQNEAYKHLLIAACNHLSGVFPFLFERISDYTELLLPDDLTSDFSIITDVRKGMLDEDCKNVEVIGWLYQFYISERKDELINAKKKYKADEIAPVTQLFTPKWIVQYMVDNTLGQIWTELYPDTNITKNLEFYIKPNNPELIPKRKSNSIEEIKFFDPCVGSAHILSYAFDLFYMMYEESGYNPSEIPKLIISKNLYGIDIDERAAQLAGFVLMMKGREYNRRFLRKSIEPNITAFQNIDSHPKFKNAKVLGSLIKVTKDDINEINIDESSLFGEQDKQLYKQAKLLSDKYDIVVTNPPYLNSSYMDDALKQYVNKEYKDTKSDLFACFAIRAKEFSNNDGLIGFISPYVWMFINSYKELREKVIKENTIASLIQLEYNAFEPAVVPIATFVLRNSVLSDYKGSYIKLSDFKGHQNQAPKTLEAIQNPHCAWFYTANQKDFEKIPGNLIGYWQSKESLQAFEKGLLRDFFITREGMATAGNDRFMRVWSEIPLLKAAFESVNKENFKWFPYNKGGSFKRWYGNDYFVVNWENNGKEIQNNRDKITGRIRSHNYNGKFAYKSGVTWSALTSGKFSARWTEEGYLFDSKGAKGFAKKSPKTILGFLNSCVAQLYLDVLAPTLDYKVGDVIQIPYFLFDSINIEKITNTCIGISKNEWDSRETSWDFQQNELIRFKVKDIVESYEQYQQYWKTQFHQLHKNEEELNRQFIEIYGLQDELTPDVPLEDITILKEETKIVNGELLFQANEVFAQFISYAVGCMFGRYSLDKEGLILANQGETLEDYLNKIGTSTHFDKLNVQLSDLSFVPDADNIIPILDEEWFEDDIVGRFNTFLKASFGAENFQKNLYFVEEQIGMDIRKYFTKNFYKDHIKRYKKRPIYWMFSSAKGSFNVLIYMHRYTPDTLSNILNKYLREYSEKLKNRKEHLQQLMVSGTASQKTSAIKENEKWDKVLMELQDYEREVLYPLATERITIDLDDGVLVNYNKFGKAIKEVAGLNDKKAKAKVMKFDWIEVTEIR
jgi:type II restriction/modification system DNA methylase subunit YeeA